MTDAELYDRILATITEQLAEQGLPDANPSPLADAVWEVLGHGFSDEVPRFDGLDAAWAAAEAALPEGWEMHLGSSEYRGGWVAYANQYQLGRAADEPFIPMVESAPFPGSHPTKALALHALAARLTEPVR